MTEPLPETDAGTISAAARSKIEELSNGKSVVAIGPGISRDQQTAELVRSLVWQLESPIVLDADGLNAFEGRSAELNGKVAPIAVAPVPII